MSKKLKLNPQLRKVTLERVQRVTRSAWEGKKKLCFEAAQNGAPCYSELHTPTVVKDIFEAMTPEEFDTFSLRIATAFVKCVFEAMTPEEFAGWVERLYPIKAD